jgi:hypothetical protein
MKALQVLVLPVLVRNVVSLSAKPSHHPRAVAVETTTQAFLSLAKRQ